MVDPWDRKDTSLIGGGSISLKRPSQKVYRNLTWHILSVYWSCDDDNKRRATRVEYIEYIL